jgi:hypothetical protein
MAAHQHSGLAGPAIPAVMDPLVLEVVASIEGRDWGRLNPLLHWTGLDEQAVRSRVRVLPTGHLAIARSAC